MGNRALNGILELIKLMVIFGVKKKDVAEKCGISATTVANVLNVYHVQEIEIAIKKLVEEKKAQLKELEVA